jgi:hypothetical protein
MPPAPGSRLRARAPIPDHQHIASSSSHRDRTFRDIPSQQGLPLALPMGMSMQIGLDVDLRRDAAEAVLDIPCTPAEQGSSVRRDCAFDRGICRKCWWSRAVHPGLQHDCEVKQEGAA